jgi:triosephosphate isomerase
MSKTYIVGNWKMNFSVGESSVYLHKLLKAIPSKRDLEIIVAPNFLSLQSLSLQTDRKKIKLCAQNLNPHDFGAYTGEVSAAQLASLVDFAIIGHSERRYIFGETNREVRAKVAASIRNRITPILCLGETADQRQFGETNDVLYDQLIGGLADIALEDLPKVILAYEPVWAISSNKNAKFPEPQEIEDAVIKIRGQLGQLFSNKVANQIPILYGGSVNSNNAAAYLSLKSVNGLLIGGASLILDEFTRIAEIAAKLIEVE